jgi:hypothetical protein
VVNVGATNIPRQTTWDLHRVWERMHAQLPDGAVDAATWKRTLHRCVHGKKPFQCDFPTTKDAYKLRKLLDGLVIGPIDKNNGELWMCCPTLYERALRKMYSAEAGYDRVYPVKFTPHMKRRFKTETILKSKILPAVPPPKKSEGKTHDVMKVWEKLYKERGWGKYASFNKRGGLNRPYILFKAKNIVDPAVRAEKWMKARPIAPGTKHPMRTLLRMVGRAWYFATMQWEADHLVLKQCDQVPKFLREAEKLNQMGDLRCIIRDVEGCYPNMPKPAIREALKQVATDVGQAKDAEGVWVPKRSTSKPCRWTAKGARQAREHVMIPWEVMTGVMKFALDNAILELSSGEILRQREGIPMGDPISPAMTIAALAWMEQSWLKTIEASDRRRFKAGRYMDDIVMVYAASEAWNHEKLIAEFEESRCYQAPLKLEPGGDGTFLESTFEVKNDTIRFWLKNQNEGGQKSVWRYQHWHSYASYEQKRATLMACLRKVQRMASDSEAMEASAWDKLREFADLGYPRRVLRMACNYLGATTRERAWFEVRDGM